MQIFEKVFWFKNFFPYQFCGSKRSNIIRIATLNTIFSVFFIKIKENVNSSEILIGCIEYSSVWKLTI